MTASRQGRQDVCSQADDPSQHVATWPAEGDKDVRPAVPEALQERLTREGTVEAIEEAANAAAKAYTDHGLSGDPFHAIVMPLRRALSYLARPAVPEALDVELGAPFWCYQHDRFCQYPIGPHRPAGAALTASATEEPTRLDVALDNYGAGFRDGSARPAAPVALDVDAIEADARERTGHPHFGCIPAWAWRAAILAALRSKEPTDDRD